MSAEFNEELLGSYLSEAEAQMLRVLPREKELHHRFSRRFRRSMRALIREERRSPKMRYYMRQMRNVAAVFVLVIAMAFVLTMSVEAARKQFFEVITKVYEQLTELKIDAPEDAPMVDTLCEPSYVPKGYVLEKQENHNSVMYDVWYVNDDGNRINYSQNVLGGTVIFDTEDAYTDTRMIGGWEVHLIEKNGLSQVYWYDDSYFYMLDGIIELRELVKMAESVIK